MNDAGSPVSEFIYIVTRSTSCNLTGIYCRGSNEVGILPVNTLNSDKRFSPMIDSPHKSLLWFSLWNADSAKSHLPLSFQM